MLLPNGVQAVIKAMAKYLEDDELQLLSLHMLARLVRHGCHTARCLFSLFHCTGAAGAIVEAGGVPLIASVLDRESPASDEELKDNSSNLDEPESGPDEPDDDETDPDEPELDEPHHELKKACRVTCRELLPQLVVNNGTSIATLMAMHIA